MFHILIFMPLLLSSQQTSFSVPTATRTLIEFDPKNTLDAATSFTMVISAPSRTIENIPTTVILSTEIAFTTTLLLTTINSSPLSSILSTTTTTATLSTTLSTTSKTPTRRPLPTIDTETESQLINGLIIAGSVVGVILLLGILVFLYRKIRKLDEEDDLVLDQDFIELSTSAKKGSPTLVSRNYHPSHHHEYMQTQQYAQYPTIGRVGGPGFVERSRPDYYSEYSDYYGYAAPSYYPIPPTTSSEVYYPSHAFAHEQSQGNSHQHTQGSTSQGNTHGHTQSQGHVKTVQISKPPRGIGAQYNNRQGQIIDSEVNASSKSLSTYPMNYHPHAHQ